LEYYIIISGSIVIILSYLFSRLSERTNIPSVLLLIALGLISKEIIAAMGLGHQKILDTIHDLRIIELLGTLGLIMIVLEAALDLKITKEKLPLITRSFLSGLIILVVTNFGIAGLFYLTIKDFNFIQAMIYANPVSILSSAIVIPSVKNLDEKRREFHIYDSTFSDILGIMMFYFLVELARPSSNALATGDFLGGVVITIMISLLLSYALIYVFQNMETKVKIFLMISVLLLLFSVGKLMHLSSLLIILVFGLILSNQNLFFSGPLKALLKKDAISEIYETFHMITMESAFVVRTFFFFLFGFTISLTALFNFKVAVISVLSLIIIYCLRGVIITLLSKVGDRSIRTLIAPRGLITLLLFYSIPDNLVNSNFNEGILLYVILITGGFMTYGLVKFSNSKLESATEELSEDIASDDPKSSSD
jgi:cell volume regulation protein A